MHKNPLMLAGMLLMSGTVFAADTPGADWITLEEAAAKARQAGYTQLHALEADDGKWQGEGLKADGRKYEFHIDPRSGTVIKDKLD
ncbi:PepSY domain-containing protein [Stutzerimonas kirkiae]|uniref:PepSY domain-containing protein n=1 Tax=Stutzerimonas kirkiae TaxID=2211392 RepID=A0A4Q9R8C0_9GAMM|nr:PepSY domain-containing protein [Stutzerimonas kirkiae]TBU96879.1 PepSY domain-containing protein [Stutzerimonas kirkiae]TBV00523.1 PepSY domain-containing protein [Stutzerimonas kirkiae]TBV04020.1 PepSY domain-containing protein [Stutzerimonas kirkiae]TBV16742.1 PepSY domain-containing protein [Stutzerimonas kirkiae]